MSIKQRQEFSMRLVFSACLAVLVLFQAGALAEEPKDFELTVDGQQFPINAGDTIKAKTKAGTDIKITLKRSEFSTYSEDVFSFQHRSDLSISATNISDDIRQILMTSALGSMTIVQTYKNLNPKSMAQFMLDQLTEDDVKAGAKVETKPTTRKLSDGTEMNGLAANVKLREKSEVLFEVMTYAVGDGGIIAISRIDAEYVNGDQPIIDHFWKTLKVTKQ
jgi:hypothetical protein